MTEERPGGLRGFFAGMFPTGSSPWTTILIAVNAAIYLGTVQRAGGLSLLWAGPDPQALLKDGGASGYTVWGASQVWRTVTYQFLHAGILHIGFNMWALAVLGPMCERLFGRARFVFLYLAGGVAGGLLATGIRYLLFLHHGPLNLLSPTDSDIDAVRTLLEPTVGASGAILGLMGAILASTVKPGTRTNPALRPVVLKWLVWVFLSGFLLKADNLAHLGGVLGGFVAGLVLGESWKERRLPSWVWGIVSALLIAGVVISFFLVLHQATPSLIGVDAS